MKTKEIWTIGHSVHPMPEFVAMLKAFNIGLLADIRSYPGSRHCPQFNKESLEVSLNQNAIQYIHLRQLGGRRKTKPDSQNTAWRNAAFRGYADYMETEDFKNATQRLQALATDKRVAMMCSEAVWWRCHRSLVSDYLKFRGWKVMHIMGIGKADEHPYTKAAVVTPHELSYAKE